MTGADLSPADHGAPWQRHLPRGVPASYPLPEVTVDRLLDDAAQDFPAGVAVMHRGRRFTWRQVQDQADRFATALSLEGMARGSRVVVALPSIPQAVVALFAIWRLGATAVLVDPEVEEQRIAAVAGELDCMAVIVEHQRRRVANLLPSATQVITTGPEDVLPFPRNVAATVRRSMRRHARTGDRVAQLVRRHPPLPVTAWAPARTSGDAAAVCCVRGRQQAYSHRHLLAAAFHLRLWLPDVVAGSERLLSNIPVHEPMGLTAVVTAPVLAAATLVLVRGEDGKQMSRGVDRYDPTLLVTGGAADAPARMSAKAPALRVWLHSGPCDPEAARDAESRTGARVRGWWAPPESPGLVLAEPVYGLTKPGTVGIPVTDNLVRVADPCGVPVPHGAYGDLWVRGPQLPHAQDRGRRDPATDWLRTGTRASLDADGFVTLEATR